MPDQDPDMRALMTELFEDSEKLHTEEKEYKKACKKKAAIIEAEIKRLSE